MRGNLLEVLRQDCLQCAWFGRVNRNGEQRFRGNGLGESGNQAEEALLQGAHAGIALAYVEHRGEHDQRGEHGAAVEANQSDVEALPGA